MKSKLFTASIDKMLFKQYPMGSDLAKQKVVAKIFNPAGVGRWYLLNSDPNDPDYLWVIADLFGGIDIGSVSRKELENVRVQTEYTKRFKMEGMPLERDLYFTPVNALELYKGLQEGKFYAKGGKIHDPADLYAQLNEAENNFSKDNGAEYNRLLALISENRANYYKALNEAENNFSKDNGAEYNRLYSMRNKFAHGGTVKKKDLFGDGGMKDLFEDYDNMPPKLRRIYDNNQDVFMDGDYAELEKVLKQMEAEGYTFDYGLSGEAYGLRPIGTNLNDLEGYEEFAKGGVVNYSIMDNRNGKVVKGGFATENEAKKHMYSLFEKSPKEAFYYSIKTEKFAKGGKMASKPFQKK
jgi:hypothetical protein